MANEAQFHTSQSGVLGTGDDNHRSSDSIRKNGNHLQAETSFYLRQHAHNPVDWYPWNDEALFRASREDKPIFLSIGYSSCHWCHVMEREVFEDDSVADFLNRHFISIKVDREERPDLDKVYMDAVLALTGRGGWPMSVFLTPDQKPFFGGTYFPRNQFLSLVTRLMEIYRERRSEIDTQAANLYNHISSELKIRPGTIRDETISRALQVAKQNFDEVHGGSRAQVKFPMPVSWRFLLHAFRKNGDRQLGQMIEKTLDQISSGGLQDHVAGGFHRYATEPTWLVPHFEKMLYDNALLAGLYLEASRVFDNPRYLEIGRDTLDFIIEEMSSDDGGFYSSLDADSGGVEGSFYLWTPEEINAVAGPRDGPVLSALLGVEPGGNFEGKSILTRRIPPAEVARKSGRDESEVSGLFGKYRTSLRVARTRRVAPGLDRKIITSWNGLAISALARGYRSLGDPRYRQAAQEAADYLMKLHSPPTGLVRSSTDGVRGPAAILDDYAFFAVGLLDLYQATGELWQLKRALKLINLARKKFRHPGAAFYLTSSDTPAPMGRQVEIADGVRPCGNSAMLSALLTASGLTGDPDYLEDLQGDLQAYVNIMDAAGMEMAGWLDVVLRHQGPHYQAVVVGDSQAAGTRQLLAEFHRLDPANAVLVGLPATGPSREATRLMPSVAGKQALDGKPTAFVCTRGSCQKPTRDPVEFGRQLLSGWKR